MQRIAGPGALPGGHWSDGNPFTVPPTDGTIATASWFESAQEELAAVVEATGRTLDSLDNAQLLASIRDLIANSQTRRRQIYVGARTGSSGVDVIGMTAPTLLGTLAASVNVRGAWLQFTTPNPATTPEDVGLVGPFDVLQRRWPVFDATFQVDIQTLTNSRLWVGLFSADPSALSLPSSLSCLAFRYEAGVDAGATWRTVSANGSSALVKDSLSPVAVSTSYQLRVRHAGSGRFEFLINGSVVTVHDEAASEPVPANTTSLGPVAALRHTSDTSSKNFRFGFFAA